MNRLTRAVVAGATAVAVVAGGVAPASAVSPQDVANGLHGQFGNMSSPNNGDPLPNGMTADNLPPGSSDLQRAGWLDEAVAGTVGTIAIIALAVGLYRIAELQGLIAHSDQMIKLASS